MLCLGEKPRDYQCRILLLDDSGITVDVKSTSKGHVIVAKIVEHLHLVEKDYFGLRYLDSTNQTHWLDPTKTVGSQLKDAIQHTFYFGVKFYAADPCKLQEEVTRYQVFLQVKRDILQGRLPISFDTAAELGALAVQSELGDFDPKRHSYGYVSEFRFVPNQTEDLEVRIMQLHRTLAGQVPVVAEYKYLDKVKWLEMYGVDLHPVQGEGNVEYFVGLTPTGVVVYRNKSKVGNYFWPRITKVTFKGKVFMLKVKDKNNDENTYAFECNTKQGCKHLWKCCVEHHAFFRLTQASDSINNAGKLFTMGSRYRYSGRTERETITDAENRPPPQVMRTPSRRHQRRASVENKPEGYPQVSAKGDYEPQVQTVISPEHVQVQQQPPANLKKMYNYSGDSPRSTRSAPWESSHHRKGGLYTSGRESPLSVRSEKMMFPNNQRRGHSGSESESGYRRRSNRRESDNDSDASSRRHRRRRNRGADSGSESESGHRHKQRHSRKSTDNVSYSEHQWKAVQQRVRDGFQGSLNSMPDSEQSHQSANRRRRRRSRSPGKKPPNELAQHFRYVEPEPGMTEDQLRDIPYTKVETNTEPVRLRQSPHSRHRHRSPKRRSYGENSEGKEMQKIPKDEAPPPYNSAGIVKKNSRSHPSLNQGNIYRSRQEAEQAMMSPVSVYRNEAQTAPIVKTKMNVRGVAHTREDSGFGIDPNEAPSRPNSNPGSVVSQSAASVRSAPTSKPMYINQGSCEPGGPKPAAAYPVFINNNLPPEHYSNQKLQNVSMDPATASTNITSPAFNRDMMTEL